MHACACLSHVEGSHHEVFVRGLHDGVDAALAARCRDELAQGCRLDSVCVVDDVSDAMPLAQLGLQDRLHTVTNRHINHVGRS